MDILVFCTDDIWMIHELGVIFKATRRVAADCKIYWSSIKDGFWCY